MSYLSTWMEGLTPELEEKAFEELGETPEVKTQSIKDMRRIINEQADFRPRTDDAFLVRFLRAKKYKVQLAFDTLRNYYIFKAKYSGIFTDFLPSNFRHILELNNLVVLPKRHPSGAAVGIVRLGNYDFSSMSPEEIAAMCFLCLEHLIETEATQVAGYIIIFDLAKVGLSHIRKLSSPRFLYRVIKCTQDCIPFRIKAVHILNEPFCINIPFNIFKYMLSEKIKNRIFFHGSNMKKLHQEIPTDILPLEYGGKAGPFNSSEYSNRVLSRDAQFEKINKFGYQDKAAHFIKKQDSKSIFVY